MKRLFLLLCFSFALTPFAMAESAEYLFLQGRNADGKGNYAEAAKWYEQACNGGDVRGCGLLGVRYAEGKGVKQNYAQAAKLFKQACNGGDTWGCGALGELYANGQGKRQDLSTAKEYYGKACDLGYQDGCDWYKKLNIQGY